MYKSYVVSDGPSVSLSDVTPGQPTAWSRRPDVRIQLRRAKSAGCIRFRSISWPLSQNIYI